MKFFKNFLHFESESKSGFSSDDNFFNFINRLRFATKNPHSLPWKKGQFDTMTNV